mmetsp:Transcript_53488/g.130688  ORF Transcript_53488/g.130688 Transcript_53488/m.130688 type:complete len:823 (-) Transcript_53488:281-2749(-)|eukprot:CAMPEP_0206232800 /NCGR_PEP_ID=MMETSP0047_2-20121206/11617_1 /ASSEMBLY_ACC=CAM_ASM_000192 /TAXON_ID=195065 /ORGANISM="Chroomonas mesostigmatica_cf, Strain CCMP1168" /LENGTH=822 /DNA_ID=CAMNT_0053656577 /DNA_START=295 /DNA_END=2763 /DNA_ORIENTATION=+
MAKTNGVMHEDAAHLVGMDSPEILDRIGEPPDDAEEAFVQALLHKVCDMHGFVYAEGMHATTTGLVLCDAKCAKNKATSIFHDESKYFVFPLQVGTPGRVWMRKKVELVVDVQDLHPNKFIRKRIARKAKLHGLVAVPYLSAKGHFLVLSFFAETPLEASMASKVAESVELCTRELLASKENFLGPFLSAKEILSSGDDEFQVVGTATNGTLSDYESRSGAAFQDVHGNHYFLSFLQEVCEATGFVFAESLCPTKLGMTLSDARWAKTEELHAFHRGSKHFVFPLQVGAPGRVWKRQMAEWHADVTALPAHKYLRRELAMSLRLKGIVAVPVKVPGRKTCCVCIFYSDRMISSKDADLVVETVFRMCEKQNAAFLASPEGQQALRDASPTQQTSSRSKGAGPTSSRLTLQVDGRQGSSPGGKRTTHLADLRLADASESSRGSKEVDDGSDQDESDGDSSGSLHDNRMPGSNESDEDEEESSRASLSGDREQTLESVIESEVNIEDRIGQGSAAHVYRARYEDRLVAVKILKPDHKQGSFEYQDFIHEAGILSFIKHRNIVGLIGASATRTPPWMLYELCLGTLEDYVESSSHVYKPDWDLVYGWCFGLASALAFLSIEGMVHRDVKPGNILLANNYETLKLADFGFCIGECGDWTRIRKMVVKRFGKDADASAQAVKPETEGPTGTYRYMSKEAFNCEPPKESSDIYSASLVIWYMCTGERPFAKVPTSQLQEGIVHRKGMRPKATMVQWSQLASLVEAAWDVDPLKRPSAERIKADLLRFKTPKKSWGKSAVRTILGSGLRSSKNKVSRILGGLGGRKSDR